MISPSRNVIPMRLLGGMSGDKEISRLEFHSVGHVAAVREDEADRRKDEMVVGAVMDEASVALCVEAEATEVQARIEAARNEARAEAREEWTAEMEECVAAERARVVRLKEEFTRERSRYFAEVESEVVKLALAIAARVLHREASLDPLLLSGVVRVALEKITGDDAIILRVPVAEVERWRSLALSGVMDVIAEEGMKPGECLMETSVGRVELGVKAQLEEIEKGFFDLLQQRPS
jgi:flagellar assembly protein FliH